MYLKMTMMIYIQAYDVSNDSSDIPMSSSRLYDIVNIS